MPEGLKQKIQARSTDLPLPTTSLRDAKSMLLKLFFVSSDALNRELI